MNPDIQITELPGDKVQVAFIEKVPNGELDQVVNIAMDSTSLMLFQLRADEYFRAKAVADVVQEPSVHDKGNAQKSPWGDYPNANLSPEADR